MQRRIIGLAVTLTVLAAGLSACGSGAATSPRGAQGAGQHATGKPIEIYDIGPDPNAPLDPTGGQAGMEAAVNAINNSGGINGRPIHVTYCNGQMGTATLAVQCAQAAAKNPDVVADIGHISVYGQVNTIETSTGLVVSGYTLASGDYTPSNWFPLVVGGFVPQGAAAAAVKILNAKRLCHAYIDAPGVGAQAELMDRYVLKPRGLAVYKNIGLAPTASDLSPQAAEANGCDAIVLSSSTQQSIQYINAVRSRGNSVPIICNPAMGPSALEQAFGNEIENIYDVGWFYRNSPGFGQYQKDMDAKGYANTQYDNDNSIMAWAALHELAAIAKTLPTVTRQSVLDAYKRQTKVTTMGLTPSINFTVPQAGADGIYPVVRNDTTVLHKYKDGKYSVVGDPQHPFVQTFPGSNASATIDTAGFTSTP